VWRTRLLTRLPRCMCARSWYNRAGVERVMGFCTDAQYETFMKEVPAFEKALVDSGTVILKFWLVRRVTGTLFAARG
jgi:polyphosphate kinase 2 (PPK2 family)